ncbi:8-oxo-dGTP diphosphatase [Acutalibacter muris]|uniref:8-oxo-dGTP diphosphatase n=1 Tax=Acutalibacter muris TaxID=1796620 RepID=UPI00272A12A0|nr:8-oxo-dGTP diphosphatase [Acutalibacter muris]
MSRKVQAELVTMCMVYDGDRVLVQDRVDPGWPGVAFPGGHVEPEETFTEAAAREVYEETGLKIVSPKLCGVKERLDRDGSRYIVFLYKCDEFSGELRSCDEGENRWVERADLESMKLADTMYELLPVFFEDSYSEFFLRRGDNGEVQELRLL